MATIEKRIAKNGKVSYRAKVRIKGYPIQSETFSKKTQAALWAERLESRLKDGARMSAVESRRRLLKELIDKYIEHTAAVRGFAPVGTIRHLKVWRDIMGDYALASITPQLISEGRDKIAAIVNNNRPKTHATLNRYTAALSVALSYAVKELEWLDINPMSRVSKLSEPRGRVRYLSDKERVDLLENAQCAVNPYLYPVILLAITTGARRMEILGLRWDDIDFNQNRAILHDTKNGERRSLPLVEPALGELKKLYKVRGKNSYVFPSHDGTKPYDIKRSWEAALDVSGITNFRFHDLRHTCASYLAMNGATMGEIATILGHKTLQMTKRYAHLSDEHSKTVVQDMTQKIFGDIANAKKD